MRPFAFLLLALLPALPAAAQRSFGTAPESLPSPPIARTETEKRILFTFPVNRGRFAEPQPATCRG
jgi:hypothetical protein